MFKSIQWKVLTVFVSLIISVMIVVGTFLLSNINKYYHDEFTLQMQNNVFTSDLKSQLSNTLSTENPHFAMQKLLEVYAGRIGVDSFRNYYILNNKAYILYCSDEKSSGFLNVSQNLLYAMEGKTGNNVDMHSEVMDFAYPLIKDGKTAYIIYVCDSKDEVHDITNQIFQIIIWVLLLGLIMSVILGLILSRTIISPIISLKRKAEKIASGDFDNTIEVKSRDEIADLTVTFNTMASELKNTLTDISTEKNKIETILKFMDDGVMAFSRDGNIIHINPAAQKMMNISENTDVTFDSFFKSYKLDVSLAQMLYLPNYKTTQKIISVKNRDIQAFFAPFMTDDHRVDGVVVVFHDITEQLKLNNSRREFVANVSHELRTPLTTVKSYTETLAENAVPGSMEASFLEVINNETDRMTRLVKDLLTLSRLDYDKSTLTKTSFSVVDLIADIIKKLSIDAKKRNHKLEFVKKGNVPMLYGDKDRIEQVIINIISNALKYTPDGGKIEVSCDYFFTDAVIKVKDNGIGIPESDLPRIFERFYRVDKARSRQHGGTGLGLAIAREIIKSHGGKIEINSKQGIGTEVMITIPLYSK